MTLVKAKMAFYHDSVGTRAHNEVFEVQNAQTVAQLEQAGYVEKADNQATEAYQQNKASQQEMGQAGQQANDAISQAHHLQNQEANAHQQNVTQARQAKQAQPEAEQQPKANAKKAEKE
jgi:hypothetical protein